ncbi:MAG: ABC transporter substrate-binding protein [Hyphomicrobiales bacterium]|nr:ABC transporter substrate-binding protein [Hyphomicrobiales bacterium]
MRQSTRGPRGLLAVLLLSVMAISPASAAETESTDPIRISLNDWTSQFISSRIMGGVLEAAGYNVAYVQADYLGQLKDMEAGRIDLAMEMWSTTATEAMAAAEATGRVETVGPTGMIAREDWWFPDYMLAACPKLPDWRGLLELTCAEAFSTPDTAPRGLYLGGVADWGGFDPERIAALNLPFDLVHAESTPALIAALKTAYEAKLPIMLWLYSPHWAPTLYDGEWVEFPAWEEACYADPSWGVNPKMAYDCAKPTGPIWKAASTDLKTKWPGAYKAIQAYTMSNEAMEAMLVEVQRDGKSVEDIVADWLADNENTWRKWIE